jgi:hypothetical protein
VTDLDSLLGAWAAAHRLSDRDIATVRSNVRAAVGAPDPSLDVDWLWNLLRPVTSLLDKSFVDDDRPLTPYLQLA